MSSNDQLLATSTFTESGIKAEAPVADNMLGPNCKFELGEGGVVFTTVGYRRDYSFTVDAEELRLWAAGHGKFPNPKGVTATVKVTGPELVISVSKPDVFTVHFNGTKGMETVTKKLGPPSVVPSSKGGGGTGIKGKFADWKAKRADKKK